MFNLKDSIQRGKNKREKAILKVIRNVSARVERDIKKAIKYGETKVIVYTFYVHASPSIANYTFTEKEIDFIKTEVEKYFIKTTPFKITRKYSPSGWSTHIILNEFVHKIQ